MKFGALLRSSAEDSPELQGLFVCYKQLKKKIKQLPGAQPAPPTHGQQAQEAEASFVSILSADVHQFNDLFIEREEDCVIRLGSVEEAAEAASTPEEIAQVYRRSVNLHGQLLLMVHWSILAYTGLVKILKKHNKRTGTPIQAPHLDNLLSQPFCSVELLSQLVRMAETTSQQLADRLRSQGHTAEVLSTRSSASSIDELILAARSSVQELAADSAASPAGQAHPSSLLGSLAGPAAKRRRTEPGTGSAAPAPAPTPAEPAAPRGMQAPQHGTPAAAASAAEAAAASQGQPAYEPEPQRPDQQPVGPAATQPPAAAAPAASAAPAAQAAAAAPAAPAAPSVAEEQAARTRLVGSSAPLPSTSGATILRQTQAALGLWESLHGNAATPSTVLQPHRPLRHQPPPNPPAPRAQSVNNSA